MKTIKCPRCGNPIEERGCILGVCVNRLKKYGIIELEIGCPHCPAPSKIIQIDLPDNLDLGSVLDTESSIERS